MSPLLLEACTEPEVTIVMVAVATATPCTGSGGKPLSVFSPTAATYKSPSAGLGQGGHFALGRVVNHQAFTVLARCEDQSPAIATGNQISVGLEEEAANVLLIALEKDFRSGSVGGYIDT